MGLSLGWGWFRATSSRAGLPCLVLRHGALAPLRTASHSVLSGGKDVRTSADIDDPWVVAPRARASASTSGATWAGAAHSSSRESRPSRGHPPPPSNQAPCTAGFGGARGAAWGAAGAHRKQVSDRGRAGAPCGAQREHGRSTLRAHARASACERQELAALRSAGDGELLEELALDTLAVALRPRRDRAAASERFSTQLPQLPHAVCLLGMCRFEVLSSRLGDAINDFVNSLNGYRQYHISWSLILDGPD